MPVLYLKRFMEMYHGTLEITQGKVVSLGKIYKKYKISKREQEVILLICEGKTNKEIEDELFISLQTVKYLSYLSKNRCQKQGTVNQSLSTRFKKQPPRHQGTRFLKNKVFWCLFMFLCPCGFNFSGGFFEDNIV